MELDPKYVDVIVRRWQEFTGERAVLRRDRRRPDAAGGLMRGRKPTPAAIKRLRGNPGKRRLNDAEPRPQADLAEPPAWLTAEQKAGWSYAIEHAPLDLLKRLDRSLLTVWTVAENLHRDAAQKVATFGLVTKSPQQGIPVQNPYLAILNKQATIMLKAASELGFTPASRPRIHIEPTPEGDNPFRRLRDDWDDF